MSNCIVTGGSGNDAAPMGVLLLNLKETQSWIDHVVIYHDGGISPKDQSVMQSILSVEFIEYKFPGNSRSFNEIVRYVYTPTIFCKYECLKLLEHFDNVVWTDYDVLFQRDVPELLGFGKRTCGIKMLIAKGTDDCSRCWGQVRGQGIDKMKKYCNPESSSLFTGLMVFNRNVRDFQKLYEECILMTEEFGEWLVLPEQAVFDMALAKLSIEPEAIPWEYATIPKKGEPWPDDAPILHSVAQPKFWNGLEHPVWNVYYDKWLIMGGSSWRPMPWYSLRNLKKRLFFLKQKLSIGK